MSEDEEMQPVPEPERVALGDLPARWRAEYAEYLAAANENGSLDDARAQRAIGVAFKRCAWQLADAMLAAMPDAALAAENGRLRDRLDATRARLADLAAGLEPSAAATAPSRKSVIEQELAARLHGVIAGVLHGPAPDAAPQEPDPVVIEFDINEGVQAWFGDLAEAVRDQSGGRVIITHVDAAHSDVIFAVASRPVGEDEAFAILERQDQIAIGHEDDEDDEDEPDPTGPLVDFEPLEPGQ